MQDISVTNLRGLEQFLLTFAERIPSGTYLDIEIDGKRIQVSYHQDAMYNREFSASVRRILDVKGVAPSDHYKLRRIRDGGIKISTPLHIIAEHRSYRTKEGAVMPTILSYLTIKPQ